MGTLVAWHYPTNLFARLADHTYVACGTGARAWSCWGGKTGGNELRRGEGSTARADAIATPNEKARISCYLINGVCHQAANRILLPAGFTVRGARGYWVSEAMYGTYGRPHGILGTCKSPFYHHDDVHGDLSECAPTEEREDAPAGVNSDAEERYFQTVVELYRSTGDEGTRLLESPDQALDFQMTLFEALVEHRLGFSFLKSPKWSELKGARRHTEDDRYELEGIFFKGAMRTADFTERYNQLIASFLDRVEKVIGSGDFSRLFEVEPGERVVLGDPRSSDAAFGESFAG